MKTPSPIHSPLQQTLEALFNEMIQHQQAKVLEIARTRLPQLTADDILNPHDYPELMNDPIFNYEEGIASGLLAAQVAVRRTLRSTLGGDHVI